MHPDDHEFVYEGLSVIYKHRRSLQDRRHLLVVFSGGFGPKRGYDLNGSVVDGIRTDILWIRDLFDGDFSYYIRTHKHGTRVAEAVAALIEKIRLERGLEKHHCTLFGISKGATGALYHGLANDYPNIVAVSPRMTIGSGNRQLRPDILRQLIGEDTDEGVAEIDAVMPDLLANDTNTARNIYLFSSPADGQYKTEIAPFLADFERYDNFNFVLTDSPLVKRHRDVASYNVPLLLATVAALGEGAPPRYGHVRNGIGSFVSALPQPSLETVRQRRETVGRLTALTLRKGRLYPEGILFTKGMDTRKSGPLSRKLTLASDVDRKGYTLDTLPDDKLSRTYFENEFCDYSHGRFSSRKREGINLAGLPDGQYRLGLELAQHGVTTVVDAVPADPHDAAMVMGGKLVRLHSTGGSVSLHKGPVLGAPMPGSHFEVSGSWARGNRVHVEGRYVLPGQRAPKHGDIQYHLVFVKPGTASPVTSRALGTSKRSFPGNRVGDPLGDYGHTYFASRAYEGVKADGLAPGEYDVYVTALAGTILSSHPAGLRLSVGGAEGALECRLEPAQPLAGGRAALAWATRNRPRLVRRLGRDLRRIKRRVLAAKR
ncbi:hypothetical protein NCCP1664_04330 [Zafaria cholistanensis]|uniref:Uncharacterized protein n=1 Tax=Zafaria cholistanensis TaxID=1682741 RepID=A0A5A7NN47_9MICC|nr:hypothetical protein [Zafaria cholistanensis]GER21936.1 hypothetical protein NCCP1664_04330 [Zafaria cholistanensis]